MLKGAQKGKVKPFADAKFQQQVMSSISRSLEILILTRPPGPVARTGPSQSSAGWQTKGGSMQHLKSTFLPVCAVTPARRGTQKKTRNSRRFVCKLHVFVPAVKCLCQNMSVYLSFCNQNSAEVSKPKGNIRRPSHRETLKTTVSLLGWRWRAVREQSLAMSGPPSKGWKQRGHDISACQSS